MQEVWAVLGSGVEPGWEAILGKGMYVRHLRLVHVCAHVIPVCSCDPSVLM